MSLFKKFIIALTISISMMQYAIAHDADAVGMPRSREAARPIADTQSRRLADRWLPRASRRLRLSDSAEAELARAVGIASARGVQGW